MFSFPIPSLIVPLPLELIRVLRSRPEKFPMLRHVIPNCVVAAVPYVLESSSKSTWARA